MNTEDSRKADELFEMRTKSSVPKKRQSLLGFASARVKLLSVHKKREEHDEKMVRKIN